MAKKKNDPTEIIELEATEIVAKPSLTVAEIVNKQVEIELRTFKSYEDRIAELKDKYAGLTINGIKDTEGYEKVRLAIAELRGIRIGTDKDRKRAKAPFISAGKSIEDKSDWIITQILGIEDPFQKMKDDIDIEKEKAKQDRIAAENKRFVSRTAELTKLGAEFDGMNFKLGEYSFEAFSVKGIDQDLYEEEILIKFTQVFQLNEAKRIEEENKQKEEARKLKEEQDKLIAAQELLKKQQKELEEKQAIQAKKEQDEKDNARKALQKERLNIMAPFSKYLKGVELVFLSEMSQEDFDTYCTSTKEGFDKKEKEVQQERDKQEKERQDKAVKDALEANAEKERQDAIKKQEELDQATDKEKWAAIVAYLKAIPDLSARSQQYRIKMKVCREKVAEIINQ